MYAVDASRTLARRAGPERLGHRRGHRDRAVLAEADVLDVDEAGEVVGLQRGLARVAGVDDADRRDAHRRAGAGHVAERGHPRSRVAPQLVRRVQDRHEELGDLRAEDGLPVVEPDRRPSRRAWRSRRCG